MIDINGWIYKTWLHLVFTTQRCHLSYKHFDNSNSNDDYLQGVVDHFSPIFVTDIATIPAQHLQYLPHCLVLLWTSLRVFLGLPKIRRLSKQQEQLRFMLGLSEKSSRELNRINNCLVQQCFVPLQATLRFKFELCLLILLLGFQTTREVRCSIQYSLYQLFLLYFPFSYVLCEVFVFSPKSTTGDFESDRVRQC